MPFTTEHPCTPELKPPALDCKPWEQVRGCRCLGRGHRLVRVSAHWGECDRWS